MFDKMIALLTFFRIKYGLCFSLDSAHEGNELVPEFLLKLSDTLRIQWACAWRSVIPKQFEPGREKMCHVICEQQRCRSACASAQSDQRLCYSLVRQYNISRFYSRNFKTLASFCGCAGRFVSGLVGNSRRHVLSCRGSFFFFGKVTAYQT